MVILRWGIDNEKTDTPKPATLAVWAGEDSPYWERSTQVPVVHSVSFGGILSFSIKGGFEAVCKVLPRLNYAHRAANLGAVETIAGPPATTSHVECTAAERAAMGIPENLVRYSVGIEDVDDLIADLDQALGDIN